MSATCVKIKRSRLKVTNLLLQRTYGVHVRQVRTVRTDEARGLLWLIEEEAVQPEGSEETLLQRLFSYYGPAEGESKGKERINKRTHTHTPTRTLEYKASRAFYVTLWRFLTFEGKLLKPDIMRRVCKMNNWQPIFQLCCSEIHSQSE